MSKCNDPPSVSAHEQERCTVTMRAKAIAGCQWSGQGDPRLDTVGQGTYTTMWFLVDDNVTTHLHIYNHRNVNTNSRVFIDFYFIQFKRLLIIHDIFQIKHLAHSSKCTFS